MLLIVLVIAPSFFLRVYARKQIVAWSLWIGGFLAVIPGVKSVVVAPVEQVLHSRILATVPAGLVAGYACCLLATSLGNWTRDGAGWHLNDAGFTKQTICYSIFLTGAAVAAHSVAAAVVAVFSVCSMGQHFAPAVALTVLSWVS